jgi:hypothetical protein
MAKHRLLAQWAADCAAHLLPLFEKVSPDPRPRRAVAVGHQWAGGQVRTGLAMKAAVAAHAAARSVNDPAAVAAARAAGHAVATAHFAEHALGVVVYGLKAVEAAGRSAAAERRWQLKRLPKSLRALVESALQADRFKRHVR